MAQFVDEELVCVECSASFTFTAGEQERHADLGFTNKPKRCAPCRAAKKERMGGSGGAGGGRGPGGPREMHSAVCADCGQEARVPFKPRGDKPVFCSACFEKNK